MKQIKFDNLTPLALGAATLGSGGGGNPHYDLMIASGLLAKNGPVDLISLEELDDDAFVMPVAFMGAPLVGIEKIPSGKELISLLAKVELSFGKKVTHITAAEIGGANAFTPIILGSMAGLPILDADCLGRAFPELQMCSCNLFDILANPAFLADAHGNVEIVNGATSYEIERACRSLTMKMGSSAALTLYFMTGKQAKQALIPHSMSKAIKIGTILTEAKELFVERLLNYSQGKVLGHGIITDVNQRIENGFLNGSFILSKEDGKEIIVHYQNEYLAAYEGNKPIACTPDILIPIEEESGIPITSESLVYGQRVHLMALPSPQLWTTEAGLNLVGPQYFGYEINYNEVKI